jgi:hypothetical protein
MILVRVTSQKLPSFTRQETKKGKNKRKATEKKTNSCPWCAPNPFHLLMELTSSLQSNRVSTITKYPILFEANCVSMYIIILVCKGFKYAFFFPRTNFVRLLHTKLGRCWKVWILIVNWTNFASFWKRKISKFFMPKIWKK